MFYYGVLSEFPTIALASSFPPTFWLRHPYTRILGGHLIQPLRIIDQKIEAQRDKFSQCQNRVLNLKFPLGYFCSNSPYLAPCISQPRSSEGTVHLKATFICYIDYFLCSIIWNSGPIFLCDAVLRMMPFL